MSWYWNLEGYGTVRNYIRTNYVAILVKNEANEVYDLEVYLEVHKQ